MNTRGTKCDISAIEIPYHDVLDYDDNTVEQGYPVDDHTYLDNNETLQQIQHDILDHTQIVGAVTTSTTHYDTTYLRTNAEKISGNVLDCIPLIICAVLECFSPLPGPQCSKSQMLLYCILM